MRRDDLLNMVEMLTTQLREEEEKYAQTLMSNRSSNELSDISTRIKSLKNLLSSIQKEQPPFKVVKPVNKVVNMAPSVYLSETEAAPFPF